WLYWLSARACVRARTAARPIARRQECTATAGQDHRTRRREAHAARAKGVRRRCAGAVPVLLDAGRREPHHRESHSALRGRTAARYPDADREGVAVAILPGGQQ